MASQQPAHLPTAQPPPPASLDVSCPLCTSRFATSTALRAHIAASHPNASGLAPILPPLHPPISAQTAALPSLPALTALRAPAFAPAPTFRQQWFPAPPMVPLSPQQPRFPPAQPPYAPLMFPQPPPNGAQNVQVVAPNKTYLNCDLCSVKCDSNPQMESHLMGQKHRRKVELHEAFERAKAGFEREGIRQIAVAVWNCQPCNANLQGKNPLLQHLEATKHKRNLNNSGTEKVNARERQQPGKVSRSLPASTPQTSTTNVAQQSPSNATQPTPSNIAHPPLPTIFHPPSPQVLSQQLPTMISERPPTPAVPDTLFPIAPPAHHIPPLPPFAATKATRTCTAAPAKGNSPQKENTLSQPAQPQQPTTVPSDKIQTHSSSAAVPITKPVPNPASTATTSAIAPPITGSTIPATGLPKIPDALKKGGQSQEVDSISAAPKSKQSSRSPSKRRAQPNATQLEYLPPMKRSRPGVGTKARVARISENRAVRELPSPPRKKKPAKTPFTGLTSTPTKSESPPAYTRNDNKPSTISLGGPSLLPSQGTPDLWQKYATMSPVAVVRQSPPQNQFLNHASAPMAYPTPVNMPNPNFRGHGYSIPNLENANMSSSRKVLQEYPCALCNVICNSEESLHVHLASARHFKKLALRNETANPKPLAGGEQVKINEDGSFQCNMCNVSCHGRENFDSHLRGKLHAKRQKAKSAQSKSSSQ